MWISFLSGCIALETKYHLQDFAKQCVITTHAWSKDWVNDRIFPRRPYIHQSNARKIDALLFQNVSKYFSQISPETSYS